MEIFTPYIEHLHSLQRGRFKSRFSNSVEEGIKMALDGQPSRLLRDLVPPDILRGGGIFLTPSKLAARATEILSPTLNSDSVVLDPACGAGDLLIAAGQNLLQKSSRDKSFQAHLAGIELQDSLAQVAQARLRLAFPGHPSFGEVSHYVQQGCGLANHDIYNFATHIVLNPPFCMVQAPGTCTWSDGKVNQAALFLESCLDKAPAGVHILAILPEVLRSGTRYSSWRGHVENKAEIKSVEVYGRFDEKTDVDVFLIHLCVRDQPLSIFGQKDWAAYIDDGSCIEDYFTVRVGPVVDYRDPHSGPNYPFITSKSIPVWSETDRISVRRNYRGTVFKPPFITIRRTSSPSDTFRIKPVLILGEQEVAVENHLLLLIPRNGDPDRCRQLMLYFRSKEINHLVNERIRCRHLTVSSISRLPLGDFIE